uniref:Uncharacterized protein n=1 Tax=Arundo donax TaxID=35708 RepID=A0A0A8ZI69_ARUDO
MTVLLLVRSPSSRRLLPLVGQHGHWLRYFCVGPGREELFLGRAGGFLF